MRKHIKNWFFKVAEDPVDTSRRICSNKILLQKGEIYHVLLFYCSSFLWSSFGFPGVLAAASGKGQFSPRNV
jgi:hypothetical protein